MEDPSSMIREDDQHESTDEDEDREVEEDFTKLMASSTKKVHHLTDMLVNAKLGLGKLKIIIRSKMNGYLIMLYTQLALSDDRVWAEGLLIFYEIFHFLEEAMRRLEKIEIIHRMSRVIHGIERTKAFEEDLLHYYGSNFFETYQIRPSVGNYLRHLRNLEEREPLRLLAYVYHLYLGLLSGGQILKRKRDLKLKLFTVGGLIRDTIPDNRIRKEDAVTRFEDGRSISDIKKEIKFTMNDIASDLSLDERNSLLQEGILVFRHNLEIIHSIRGTGRVAVLNVLTHPIFIIIFVSLAFCVLYFLVI